MKVPRVDGSSRRATPPARLPARKAR